MLIRQHVKSNLTLSSNFFWLCACHGFKFIETGGQHIIAKNIQEPGLISKEFRLVATALCFSPTA